MNYLSVCSGIEAATVAWHHMGWKPVGFSEIEKFPSQVLAHHYPQVTNFGDMTKYKEWNLNDSIGLLVGGTPCQSFSVAGLRKGLDDPRGNLALTYLGILDKFRPKWCVWENVPGVLSSGGGRDFGAFLGALAELGYGFAYRVLDAKNFGVAQRRRRVFVVGHLGNWKPAAEVLFESESLSGNIKKGAKEKQETSAFTPSSFGTYSAGVGTIRAAGGDLGGGSETLYVPNVANCLQTTCNDYSRADGFNVIAMQGNLIGRDKGGPNGIGVSDGNTMYTLTKTDVHAVATSFNVNARPDEMKFLVEQSNTLTASQNSGVAIGSSKISGTLRANPGSGWRSNGTPVEAVAIQNMLIRRLTEVECERLQGFPDNYTNIKENCSSVSRYKALGNSMAVPVMRWIGERIDNYERI